MKRFSHSAVRLCTFIYCKSDRQSNRQFKARDKEIIESARLSARSLPSARSQLAEAGFLAFTREAGGEYTYTICDPKTRRPYPGDPRAKVSFKKGGKPAEEREQRPLLGGSAAMLKAPPTPCEDEDDTAFPYGFNSPGGGALKVADFNPFSPHTRN